MFPNKIYKFSFFIGILVTFGCGQTPDSKFFPVNNLSEEEQEVAIKTSQLQTTQHLTTVSLNNDINVIPEVILEGLGKKIIDEWSNKSNPDERPKIIKKYNDILERLVKVTPGQPQVELIPLISKTFQMSYYRKNIIMITSQAEQILGQKYLPSLLAFHLSYQLGQYDGKNASRDILPNTLNLLGYLKLEVTAGTKKWADAPTALMDSIKNKAFYETLPLKYLEEADNISMEILARAGYNPENYIHAWKQLSRINSQSVKQWMVRFPVREERFQQQQIQLNRVKPLYTQVISKKK